MCRKSLCTICEEREIYARGRCGRCWSYYRKHGGVDRPVVPTWYKGQYKQCVNCGESKPYSKGRCKACHTYYERNQTERPFVLFERHKEKAVLPRWCKNCGSPSITGFLRCNACYRYWKAHGKERPRRYFDNPNCKNCGIPLDTVVIVKAGHCSRCYEYKRIFKKSRPEKLWGNGPHGWCECGQPAQHMIDKFPLCNGCAVEYQKGAYS